MSIIIRDGSEADFPAILSLVKELAVFQNTPERVLNTVEQMKEEMPLFRCLIAETKEHEIVGMATYFFAYYTWVGKSLFLDDLYVQDAYRGRGIGSQLLDRIFEIARDEKCKRVRWLVSDWNKSAIEFYEKCGAEIDHEACVCDVEGVAIDNFKIV